MQNCKNAFNADYRCDAAPLDKTIDNYEVRDGTTVVTDYAQHLVKDFGTYIDYTCTGSKKFAEDDGYANTLSVFCDVTNSAADGDFDYPAEWKTCVEDMTCPDPTLPSGMATTSASPYKNTGSGHTGDVFEWVFVR